jgi:hypothetical protein
LSKLRHPSELNELQRFLQARSVMRTTNRASNDAWYEDALELDLQLHIRIDGGPVRTWIHHATENRWEPGPEIPETIFTDPEATESFLENLFKSIVPRKTKALGIILHVADEFATTEIKPELKNPSSLPEHRDTIGTDPFQIIDDSSLPPDEHAWRIFPYSGNAAASIATAVTLSRRCENFLSRCREAGEKRNFPVRTLALSAPLAMLQGLPFLYEGELGQPIVTILHYPLFTLLAFLDSDGNLAQLRTLHHRGQRVPTNLIHAISTAGASLEFADPIILLLPLADESSSSLISQRLHEAFPAPAIHLIDWAQSPFSPETTGCEFPEPPAALADSSVAGTPLSNALTFSMLRDEGWARQDFIPPALELVERHPNQAEMRLLRYARFAQLGFAAAAVLAITFMAFSVISIVRRPEWGFNPKEADALKQRLAGLGVEQKRIDQWDNLLEDRSKAWPNMEMICRLFPPHSGILLSKTHHSVKPEQNKGKAKTKTKTGFVKEWKISGFAREEGGDRLTRLNTREGIAAAFAEIARATGNSAFDPELSSRTLIVNLRTRENNSFKPRPVEEVVDSDDTSYPFTFDITITQRFESTDPMAVTASKAPKL